MRRNRYGEIVCPPISEQLLAHLEEVFADRAVDPDKTNPAVAYGQATVVRYLKEQHERQQEDPIHVPT